MPSYRFYVRADRKELIAFLNKIQEKDQFSEALCDALETSLGRLATAKLEYHKSQSEFWNDIHGTIEEMDGEKKARMDKYVQQWMKRVEAMPVKTARKFHIQWVRSTKKGAGFGHMDDGELLDLLKEKAKEAKVGK